MTDPLRSLPLYGPEIGLDNADNLRIAGTKIITNHLGVERSIEVQADNSLKVNGIAFQSGSGSSTVSPSVSLNLSAANLALLKSGYAHSRAAKAAVSGGTGSMKILMIGDSTTAGSGALGWTNSTTKAKALAPASVLAQLLNSVGLPAQSDNYFGDALVKNNGSILYAVYDPRYTAGSVNWTTTNTPSLGGMMSKNSADQTALSFLPFNAVDTFDVYYPLNTGLGTFNLSRVGDTTSGTITNVGAQAILKTTFHGALGNANPLKVTPVVNGGGVFIVGIDAYNSAAPAIRVYNAGMISSKVADWVVATNAYDYLPTLKFLAPDLTIIQPGINDAAAGTTLGNASTPGTYLGDLQTLITACKLSGDVILVTHYPTGIVTTSLATQKTYVDAAIALAATNNIAVNDLFNKWQSYESMSALSGGDAGTTLASAPNSWYSGPTGGGGAHPSANGYKSKAVADATIILSI